MTNATSNVIHLSHTSRPYARVKPVSERCCVLIVEGWPERSIPMAAADVADTLVAFDGYTRMG